MSDDLKAKLAAAEAEVKRLREAAELNTTVMNGMKNSIVRAKIAARHAVDVDAVEALVSQRIAMSETGEMYATDANGSALVGSDPGHNVGLDAYLDQIARDRPALFEQAGGSASGRSAAKGNPFEVGSPHFSMTAGMQLYRSNPDLATELALDAGLDLRNAR